jgi:hypothetical protein
MAAVTPQQVRLIYIENFDRLPKPKEFKHHKDNKTPYTMLKNWAEARPESIKNRAKQTATSARTATPTRDRVISPPKTFAIPQGYEKISGAKYPTKEAQQRAFSSIQTDPTGAFLYGIPIPIERQEGTLLKLPTSSSVYIVEGGQLKAFKDEASFKERGLSFDKVQTVRELPNLPSGEIITVKTEEKAKEPMEEEETEGETEARAALDKFLEEWDGTIEEKAILKEIFDVEEYTSGQTVLSDDKLDEIIERATTNAEADLKPYYERITGRTIEDLKRNMEDIRQDTSQSLARESVDYKKKLTQTKDSLRQRGLTFSGIGRKQLGAEGFIEAKGVEGEIPTERKLDVAARLTPFEREAREAAIKGERALGSEKYKSLSLDPRITTPYATGRKLIQKPVTGIISDEGDIPRDRTAEQEQLRWEKVRRAKLFV